MQDVSQKTLNDSINYVSRALQFIQQVKQDDLSNGHFILESQPDAPCSSCFKEALSDIIVFSRQEDQSIRQQASHPYIRSWTNHLFPGIKIVNSDTIRKIFANRSQGWDYFYQHVGHRADGFSAPIFFNSDTYCLFYSSYSCGLLCAYGSLVLYKKEGNHWIEVKSYCEWIS